MLRFVSLLAAIGVLLAAALSVTARAESGGGWQAYDASSFAAAQGAGKTIVVDVHADWCPTCRAQAPILDELRKERASDTVAFVRVDFDKDKAFLRAHRIPRQSTVLVFKGGKEVARSIAETDRGRLRQMVLGAL
ncbi:thioredoxin family protein [Porphyrobacter sp. YT40]|uniref:thioredoxin family protein n=1 Tax=Porphyrobacter sp. YT40 TaxID=2547601 RepID=UPI0011422A72|nr:thioredoxin family protein [Porphyrobacter sp. YT40]QDH34361.1 redoxin domain-containing protein [Porphyrobacter sp. YT40]